MEAREQTRLLQHLAEEQRKVSWPDRIIAHMHEHMYIVEKSAGSLVVKCSCGHEFCDPKTNWKHSSLVYDRNPKEIYPGLTGPDPEWCTYREFYCPGCYTQLEVEAVPHGMPFVFSAQVDL